jgi:hypothetical protein
MLSRGIFFARRTLEWRLQRLGNRIDELRAKVHESSMSAYILGDVVEPCGLPGWRARWARDHWSSHAETDMQQSLRAPVAAWGVGWKHVNVAEMAAMETSQSRAYWRRRP